MQQPFEVGRRDLQQRLAVLHAGVVDEDVQRAQVVLDLPDRASYGRLVGDVEGRRVDLGPGLLGQFLPRALQRPRVAAVQDEFGARLGQSGGEGGSDAFAGAGHQGAAAGEVEQCGSLHGRTSRGA